MFNFYDTSSLLLVGNQIRKEDNIVISSITLQELENIKTSMNKSPEVKYQARILTRFLEEHPDYVYVQIFNETMLDPIIEKAFTITDDMRILATAIWYDNNVHPDDVCFYTNDLALKHLANVFFGDADIKSVRDPQDYE
jgi:PhoH-like ATPase